MYYLSMVLAIAGLVTYQLAVKSAPRTVNPWWLLAAAYAVAAIFCVPAAYVWRRFVAPGDAGLTTADIRPVVYIAGAVVLIEIGYLLIYRTGWSMSVAPALAQAVTLSAMCVLGVMLFAEEFTVTKAIGLAFSLGGIFLLTRK